MAGEVIKLAAVKEPHFVYMVLGAMMVGVIAEMIDPQSDEGTTARPKLVCLSHSSISR